MIYIAARVRAALVRIMRSDGSLPRGAYKQNWAQQGRSWAPRAATRARTRVQNRPQAFSATIWKLSQTKLRYADVISYLSPGQKKKKRRKNPLFLPPNSADQWHSSPPSSWVLQHALKPSHSQQQGPDGGSWSKGKLRCLQLSSKGCKDMGVPWGDAPMGAALCPASQHSSRRLSPRQGKPWAIPVIYTWAQLNQVDPKLSPSVEQTVLNCWTKGYFRIWQYTTEAPYEHLCKAGICNWVS